MIKYEPLSRLNRYHKKYQTFDSSSSLNTQTNSAIRVLIRIHARARTHTLFLTKSNKRQRPSFPPLPPHSPAIGCHANVNNPQ